MRVCGGEGGAPYYVRCGSRKECEGRKERITFLYHLCLRVRVPRIKTGRGAAFSVFHLGAPSSTMGLGVESPAGR